MIIGKIEDGIVLDHIKAGSGMRLYDVLNLDKLECEVALIQNAPSGKMGRKDILKIDKLIDLGFIHDNSDGTISMSSIVRKLVEADYEIDPEEMLAFGETLFAMGTNDAPEDLLAEIANNISSLQYLLMIESDVLVAYHLLFQFYCKIESNFNTDMALTCMALHYNKNIFKHRLLYLADKAQFFDRIKDSENFDLIKQTLENTETNPRWHAHEDGKEPPSDPLVRSFIVSEEDDAEIFGLNDE